MGLTDVAGVFSRYFVIGFFAPAFFGLLLLSQLIDGDNFPAAYVDADDGAKVLIIGGCALLVALFLSGIHYNVLRLFEGYPLDRLQAIGNQAERQPILDPAYLPEIRARQVYGKWRFPRLRLATAALARAMYTAVMSRPRRRFDELYFRRSGPPGADRTRAAHTLARSYPDARDQLLPTRFGNAMRSFERHPRSRYGLDGITMWPRLELILSESERDVISNASIDLAFFVNSTLVLVGIGVAIIADATVHDWPESSQLVLLAIPFFGAWLTYRLAVGGAVRWGESVRAGFDLHRLDYYRRLGVRVPAGPAQEKATARKVTRMLAFGEPLDAETRIDEDQNDDR